MSKCPLCNLGLFVILFFVLIHGALEADQNMQIVRLWATHLSSKCAIILIML